jgi:hypothetical protein
MADALFRLKMTGIFMFSSELSGYRQSAAFPGFLRYTSTPGGLM